MALERLAVSYQLAAAAAKSAQEAAGVVADSAWGKAGGVTVKRRYEAYNAVQPSKSGKKGVSDTANTPSSGSPDQAEVFLEAQEATETDANVNTVVESPAAKNQ